MPTCHAPRLPHAAKKLLPHKKNVPDAASPQHKRGKSMKACVKIVGMRLWVVQSKNEAARVQKKQIPHRNYARDVSSSQHKTGKSMQACAKIVGMCLWVVQEKTKGQECRKQRRATTLLCKEKPKTLLRTDVSAESDRR
jgi:hypothetical protein